MKIIKRINLTLFTTVMALTLIDPTISSAKTITQTSNPSAHNYKPHLHHFKKLKAKKAKHKAALDNSVINANAKEDIQLPNGATAPWNIINGQAIVQATNDHQITYAFDTSQGSNNTLLQAYQQAIDHWNHLNVIKLVQIDDPSQAEIKLIGNYQNSINMNTNQTIVDPDINGTTIQQQQNGQFTYTRINLTPAVADQTVQYQSQVAEHELGHALGFEHIDQEVGINVTIMEGSEDPNSSDVDDSDVAPYFKQALQAHYPNN